MIIIISVTIMLFYSALLIWFRRGIAAFADRPVPDRVELPTVSIIIAARNEEDHIEGLMHSLFQQTYPQHLLEIVIANDRSTDETLSRLRQAANRKDRVKIIDIANVPTGWAPKKWALQSAVESSTGEILLFTDADCRPMRTWVFSMSEKFSDDNVGLVSGFAPLTAKNRFLNNIYLLDSISQDGFSAGGFTRKVSLSCTGRNMAIRRSVFDDIDGYRGISRFISGDDDLMLQKIAVMTETTGVFNFHSDAIVFSDGPDSVRTFIYQKLRFASKGISYYGERTTLGLRLILPLLYITNIIALVSPLMFFLSDSAFWIVPWILKFFVEIHYTRYLYYLAGLQWKFIYFIILSIIHPYYVFLFGSLGPFIKIKWKNNEN